jgi:SAM-dependent methyltransferase
VPIDSRLNNPAAERNKGPIGELLQRILAPRAFVLEVASGSGQHVAHFARLMPGTVWQPSDQDPAAFPSIRAWIAAERLANVREPIVLDVEHEPWPVRDVDGIVCINMIHISPWSATAALVRGAGATLRPSGVLYTYGPFRRNGRHTSGGNETFDAQLRMQDSRWGIRDAEDVATLADAAGFDLVGTHDMPANNTSLVFTRRPL